MSLQETVNNPDSRWAEGTGPEADIVISSRVRLARNIAKYPFPHFLPEEMAAQLVQDVGGALTAKGFIEAFGNIEIIKLSQIGPLERQVLVDKHLVSPQLVQDPVHRVVALNDDESLSIMINEEDHLRIQSLLSGLQLQEAWMAANKADDLLEKHLDFSYCEKRGYLTACPTNIGTGLRASVMMHLPALVMTTQINQLLQAITQLGLTARGFYGEGTESQGNFFQISNQITLGRTEEEILNNLQDVANQIIAQERSAREALLRDHQAYIEDRVARSLGILKFARVLTSREELKLLSDVRLGVDLGIVKGITGKTLNELLILTRPAFLNKKAGRDMTARERDMGRAAIIRETLARVKID